jgi:hypothetical protein
VRAVVVQEAGAENDAVSPSPTWDELGRPAVVAVVRTFLSYFLDREMERAAGPGAADRTDMQEGVSARCH